MLKAVQDEQSGEERCFHCGLPVGEAPIRILFGGAWKRVCCPGCEAVAGAILGQGLGEYYRLRDAPADPAAASVVDEELKLYDDPRIQQGFVRSVPEGREAALLLEGVRCAACTWLIEQSLRRMPGVLGAEVHYADHRATVRWDPARLQLSSILRAVTRIGYRASPFDPQRIAPLARAERRDALWRLFVAGFGMMQVMMYAVPVYLAGVAEMTADIEQLMRWASFVLTVPVVLYAAGSFFSGAARSLRSRQLDMNVTVASGIALAFGASVLATVSGTGEVYYDSVSMFVFLLLLGRFLELAARQRAAGSLQHLGRLVPQFAHRLARYPALEAEDVPAALLQPGDRVLVKPGESFPADGMIEDGCGAANESLLSGESTPVPKAVGSSTIGGSVNLTAPLVMKVERTGAETTLSAILRLVERAAAEKPRLIELADRSASVFVLFVLILACVAAAYWFSIEPQRAVLVVVSVLVATCPCALSLATPAALGIATGELSRRGLIVARRHAIEALASASDFVFDKTGTLTRGELRLVSIELRGKLAEEDCLAIAAGIESASEHPIARVILRAAGSCVARAVNIENVPGAGVKAELDGVRYHLGNDIFARAVAGSEQHPGSAGVWLCSESGPLAVFHLADELRPEAADMVASLRAAGIKLHLLSGDSVAATRAVAEQLGIENVRASASPRQKMDYIVELQGQGRRVAMVGDGINDAPVLALADVSLAMGSGTALAQLRADAVLLAGSLSALPQALGYARKCLRIVRENIGWAFVYNAAVLPLAVSGWLTPWAAAIGMSTSSLIVVLNALRLQRGLSHPGEPKAYAGLPANGPARAGAA